MTTQILQVRNFFLDKLPLTIISLLFILFLVTSSSIGQDLSVNAQLVADTVVSQESDKRLKLKPFITPASLIFLGSITYGFKGLRQIDLAARHRVTDMPRPRLEIDDYTQFVPAAIVYGLNAVNVKGKHEFIDRTGLFVSSQLITALIVLPSKRIIGRKRPDATDNFSFPSGHAALAFSSAHFMFKEYRDTNFWLSISGYPIAAFTSVARVTENRHWVSDIFAGAGAGLISTEIGYFLYPRLRKLMGDKLRKKAVLAPFIQGRSFGLTFTKHI